MLELKIVELEVVSIGLLKVDDEVFKRGELICVYYVCYLLFVMVFLSWCICIYKDILCFVDFFFGVFVILIYVFGLDFL